MFCFCLNTFDSICSANNCDTVILKFDYIILTEIFEPFFKFECWIEMHALEFDVEWEMLVMARFSEMDDAFARVECVNIFDLIGAEFEVENVDVLFNSLGGHWFWDWNSSDVNLWVKFGGN